MNFNLDGNLSWRVFNGEILYVNESHESEPEGQLKW